MKKIKTDSAYPAKAEGAIERKKRHYKPKPIRRRCRCPYCKKDMMAEHVGRHVGRIHPNQADQRQKMLALNGN